MFDGAIRLILSLVFLTLPLSLMAQEADKEFESMLWDLNQRYQDFHIHYQEKLRADTERRSAVEEHKSSRQGYLDKKKADRKQFKRPVKSPRDETAHLEALEKRVKVKVEQRKAYAKKVGRIEKLRASAKRIPENKEVGLDN